MKITITELRSLIKRIISEEIETKQLFHIKSLSPSKDEKILVDKQGNVYLYKKEDGEWTLYNTVLTGKKIETTTKKDIKVDIRSLSEL